MSQHSRGAKKRRTSQYSVAQYVASCVQTSARQRCSGVQCTPRLGVLYGAPYIAVYAAHHTAAYCSVGKRLYIVVSVIYRAAHTTQNCTPCDVRLCSVRPRRQYNVTGKLD